MNLDNMRLFVSVYETGNITQAADRAFLSHQAVSKRIASVETELGCRLFERTSSGLIPTKEGTHTYRAFTQMIERFDQLSRDLAAAHSAENPLRLAIEFYDAPEVDIAQMRAFEKHEGDTVALEVQYCTNDDCYQRIEDGRADVAVTNAPPAHRSRFEWHVLRSTRPLIIIGAKSALAEKAELSCEDLDGMTFFTVSGSTWSNELAHNVLVDHGVTPRFEEASLDSRTIMHTVEEGKGVHVAPAASARRFLKDFDVVTREAPFPLPDFQLSLVLSKKRPLKAYVDSFIDYVIDHVDEIVPV